jgi:hypothetical protein
MLKAFDLGYLLKEILVFNLAFIFEPEIKVLVTTAFVIMGIFVFKEAIVFYMLVILDVEATFIL